MYDRKNGNVVIDPADARPELIERVRDLGGAAYIGECVGRKRTDHNTIAA